MVGIDNYLFRALREDEANENENSCALEITTSNALVLPTDKFEYIRHNGEGETDTRVIQDNTIFPPLLSIKAPDGGPEDEHKIQALIELVKANQREGLVASKDSETCFPEFYEKLEKALKAEGLRLDRPFKNATKAVEQEANAPKRIADQDNSAQNDQQDTPRLK